MRSISLFFLRYVLTACLIAAAGYSFLLARAAWLFREDTADSVPAAAHLVPYNSNYLGRLAAWRTADRLALLHQAVKVNPFDFQSWIQLGFASEFQQHDIRAAEQYYLKAAAVNHMYLPRWTLANFYFRHDNGAELFRWAKAALAVTPFSPEPIFAQMWLMTQDAAKINAAVPDRPRVLLPYVWYLSNNGQNALIPGAVKRLVSSVGRRNPRDWGLDDLLAVIQDRMVSAGVRDPALEMWATLVRAGWLSSEIPTVARPVTNGRFRISSYRHGFDWRFSNAPGLRIDQSTAEGKLRVYFSGDEPEHCVLLQQYMPTEPGELYRLDWQADFSAPSKPAGLVWRVSPAQGGGPGNAVSGDLLTSGTGSWQFRAPSPSRLSRLSLEYSRPLGSLRVRGIVTLSLVTANLE